MIEKTIKNLMEIATNEMEEKGFKMDSNFEIWIGCYALPKETTNYTENGFANHVADESIWLEWRIEVE